MVSAPQMAERVNHYAERGAITQPRSVIADHVDGPGFVYLAGELLVAEENRERVERSLGADGRGRGNRPVPPGLGTIRLGPGVDPFEAARELTDGEQQLAAPNMVLTLAPHWSWGSASDPVPAGPLGSRAGTIKSPVRVAVVDTGMFLPIPAGVGIGIFESDPVDVLSPRGFVDWFGAGHGGFIAGVIDHHAGGATIDVYRGFDSSVDVPTETAIISAVDRALAGGARVINLSVGTYGPYGRPPVALHQAMRRWKQDHPELLMVAAAGNDGLPDPWYPAGFAGDSEFADWVVSVGAYEGKGTPAAFSNHGDWVRAWAPGVGVHSHYPKAKRFRSADGAVASFPDGFATWSGTSFAAPFALAAILSKAETMGRDPLAAWHDLSSAGPVTFP